MRNWKKFTLISFVVFMSIVYASQALASIQFANIQVYDIENGVAKVKWSTPGQQTKGIIYFGESSDNLNRYTGYSLYNYYHEAILTGLKKNKKYYFKIMAIDRLNNEKESFIQSFSTKDMKRDDLKNPQFTGQKIAQIINRAIMIRWQTDEDAKAVVYYGKTKDGLNKKVEIKTFSKAHARIIYNLSPDTKYNFKIVLEDRAGNKTNGKLFIINTPSYKGKPQLSITKVKPLSADDNFIFSRRATITFKTSLLAKSKIQYGKKLGKYDKTIDVSKYQQTDHKVILTNLEPDTIYFYKITAYDSFYKKKITQEMTFKTKSLAKKIPNGSLVKGFGYKVYVISGNEKLWIESAEVFNKLGYRWDWIQTIDNVFLNEYKEGKSIKKTTSHSDGTLIKYSHSYAVYLIENRKKRPFSSAEAFIRKGYDWNRIITISKKERYKTGEYL